MASLCAPTFPKDCIVSSSSSSNSSSSPSFCSLILNQSFHHRICIRSKLSPPSRRNLCAASAFRKRYNENLPPGAHEMVDEESGEIVLHFGVEDDDRLPSDDQLRWTPTKYAKPGDISEDAWYKILQSNTSTDKTASIPEDASRSSSRPKNNELLKKKSYLDGRSGTPSKGLFSKLKVQTLRSKKNMASSVPGQTLSTSKQREKKVSDYLWDDKDEEDKKIGKFRNVPQFEREDDEGRWSETSSHLLRSKELSEGRKENIVSGPASEKSFQSKRNLKAGSYREVVADDFFSIRTFKDIGANDLIIKSINAMEVTRPSQIQAMAHKHILEGRSCILADQTGSGKTLAYLTPLFQRFILEEGEGSSKSFPKKPRCLIMVPTSELAAQVLSVCRSFSRGGAMLKSMVATGGFKLKTQIEALGDSPDIVIATPGRFLQLFNSACLDLDNIKSVILDEVDVLFDDPEFADTLEKIETSTPVKTQYIHVTATLPVDVCDAILENHPTSIPLMGPGLHCTATGLQEVLVDCSGEGEKTPESAYENKKKALLQLVEQQPVSKTILFCNKIETCRKVENALKRIDRKGSKLSVLPYHAALSLEARIQNMQHFIKAESSNLSKFLVCTDRASRGLDMVDVEHVVLFDFPRDPSEYVRRVGRTARAGGVGKAFVFVVGKQVSLARKIMVRNEKGHPIHTVPAHTY